MLLIIFLTSCFKEFGVIIVATSAKDKYQCANIKNKKVIEEYIRNQIYEDKMYDQMSMKEFVDPFTGEKIK